MFRFLFIMTTLFCCVSVATAKPEKLTVILDWFPNPDHAPLIIAAQQGFFREQNLDVELIGPSDPTDPPKWVAAGRADIGMTYEPELMAQIDRGLPLIRIGTLIDKPLDCIIALENTGIKDMKDLKGKRIGTGSSGVNAIMLRSMLRHHGLNDNDVEIINVRYNLTQALLAHKVDAVSGIMRNFEIPQIELQQQKVIAFLPEENGIPNYSVLVFIANTDKIKDPRFPRFMQAVKKAVAWLDLHPQAGWQLFTKAYPEANNAVNHAAWFATMPYFAEDPAEFDEQDWQHFANFMYNNKMIRKRQPLSRYAIVLTQ